MKKISLNNFQSEKGKYTVCLGNGTATAFTNKDKAKQFLAETNDFLTKQYYYINELLPLVNTFYRHQQGYFQHNKNTSALRLLEIERYCLATFREIENSLELAINRSSWTNGNYFTFYHLQNSVTGIKTILKELQPLCKNQSATDKINSIDFYFMVAAKIESDINNYAFLGARLFKVSIHDLNYTDQFIPAITPKLKIV
jgi:hypothetical protein